MVCGEVQAANVSLSMRHSKVEPVSVESNENVGVASFVVPAGPAVIVVSGGVVSTAVSTVKSREAGVGSVLPAVSVARTSKVWAPSVSAAVVCGEVQAANASLSMRHLKVEPVSVESKEKVGVLSLVVPVGPPVIVVFGGAVSTVKSREAGVGSVLPAVSVARTSKVWAPSVSAAVVCGEVQVAKAPPSMRHSKVEPVSVESNENVGVRHSWCPSGRR